MRGRTGDRAERLTVLQYRSRPWQHGVQALGPIDPLCEADPNPGDNSNSESTLINNAHGSTIVGTSGNDTLNGTSANDVICGLGGHDKINGNNGHDTAMGDRATTCSTAATTRG